MIPAPFLGEGAFLLDSQNHTAYPDAEIVEKGQLLLMRLGDDDNDPDGHDRE